MIGVGKGMVSLYENNSGDPKLKTLVALADIFEVTLDELLIEKGTGRVNEPQAEYGSKIKLLQKENAKLKEEKEMLRKDREILLNELREVQSKLIQALE